MKIPPFAKSALAVVVGVLVAGYIMGSFRDDVDLIAKAHEGFDS